MLEQIPASLETEIVFSDLEKCMENYKERDKEILFLVGKEYTSDEKEDMDMTPGKGKSCQEKGHF